MNEQIIGILILLRREVWEKRHLFAVLFFITSMAFLFIGWFWPRTYSSYSTILVDEQNIIRPLLQGTAETTSVTDRARLARQIIFSRQALEEVLLNTGYIDSDISELGKEKAMATVEKKTNVANAGRNLIRISYEDGSPEDAYKMVKEITDVFLANSVEAKRQESQSSFEFIDSQVKEYQDKLRAKEQALKEFQSANVDARPGSQGEVSSRIVELRRRMEATSLEIRELEIRRETLKKQLSGEAAVTASLTREGQYQERLASLEEQLSTLRLSYHDSYPDIVRIKSQIGTIEAAIEAEQNRSAVNNSGENVNVTSAATKSLLYQELRSQLSAAETQLASLNARLEETKQMLSNEEERIVRINDVEAHLAELMRGYDVDKGKYEELLSVRENARISMNIDQKNQGITLKVQEPAALQLTPEGIRFAHFLAAGFVLSFCFPVGVIYGLTMVDQKVRLASTISEELELPVLASVYEINTARAFSFSNFSKSIVLVVILVSWAAYGYAAWLRVSS